MVTQKQIEAGLELVKAFAETVKDAGRLPAGHLYASVMGRVSLSEFDQIIGILCRAGLVRRTPAHELVWIA